MKVKFLGTGFDKVWSENKEYEVVSYCSDSQQYKLKSNNGKILPVHCSWLVVTEK